MIITRDIHETFKRWKTSEVRKPILIKGARQIGKTWVMEEFGRECYEHYVKFDFDEQQELASVFVPSCGMRYGVCFGLSSAFIHVLRSLMMSAIRLIKASSIH